MASFAIAHILYIRAFEMKPLKIGLAVPIYLISIPLMFIYVYTIEETALRIMVPLYSIIIYAMFWRASCKVIPLKRNTGYAEIFAFIGK